jgi:hypothetical protein
MSAPGIIASRRTFHDIIFSPCFLEIYAPCGFPAVLNLSTLTTSFTNCYVVGHITIRR